MGKFVVGLDLGQAQDYTALCVVEYFPPKVNSEDERPWYMRDLLPMPTKPTKLPSEFHCRHLERFPLGTRYPSVVDETAKLLQRLANDVTTLVVDGTGVGRAVIDMFEAAGLNPKAMTITAGDSLVRDGSYYRVPKRELVGAVQVPLQEKRLKFAATLSLAPTLIEEMLAFRVKITNAANDVYGSWREGTHDDLILAVMMAVWWLQYEEKSGWTPEAIAALQSMGRWW